MCQREKQYFKVIFSYIFNRILSEMRYRDKLKMFAKKESESYLFFVSHFNQETFFLLLTVSKFCRNSVVQKDLV